MKLKCFNCGRIFKKKSEIFRDINGWPLCEDCISDVLYDEYNENYEHIIIDLKSKFNNNYKLFLKYLNKDFGECDNEKCYSKKYYNRYLYHNSCLTKINGKTYCDACLDEININEEIKMLENEEK